MADPKPAATETFAERLRWFRVRRAISQEVLSERAGLDRAYVSELERAKKSPTLTTVGKLAACLEIEPADLIRPLPPTRADLSVAKDYLVRRDATVEVGRADGSAVPVDPGVLLAAVDLAHEQIDRLASAELDVAAVLGMRNLSAFVGELYAAAVLKAGGPLFRANPHQDGYPDLLAMDAAGRAAWAELAGREREKTPFSPFPTGGIEVKATCGAVPTPAACLRRGFEKPVVGDTRAGCLTGYDWKSHHRDTNNLAGLLWDFIGGVPRIAAVFYRSDLVSQDWGTIVQPKKGGGRTTSVSILTRSGVAKMYAGWLCVLRTGGYAQFFDRKNKEARLAEAAGRTPAAGGD